MSSKQEQLNHQSQEQEFVSPTESSLMTRVSSRGLVTSLGRRPELAAALPPLQQCWTRAHSWSLLNLHRKRRACEVCEENDNVKEFISCFPVGCNPIIAPRVNRLFIYKSL